MIRSGGLPFHERGSELCCCCFRFEDQGWHTARVGSSPSLLRATFTHAVLLADVWTVGATVVCILLVRAIYFECCGAHRDSDAKAASTPGGRRGSWVSPESGAEDTGPRRGDGLEDFPVMQSSRADAYSQSRPLRRLGTRASVDLDGAQSYVQPQQGRLLDRADTSIAVRTPEDYYAASAGRGDPGRLSPYGGSPSSPKYALPRFDACHQLIHLSLLLGFWLTHTRTHFPHGRTFGLCAYCHGSIRDEDPVWIDNQAVHAGCAACARCQQRFNGVLMGGLVYLLV